MRVRWALEEAGQPYDVRLVSFSEMKEPAHRRLHPFGQIPTYEEGDRAPVAKHGPPTSVLSPLNWQFSRARHQIADGGSQGRVMSGVWKLLSWHPFLAIGVIIVSAFMLIESFSIEVDPLMPAARILIAPLILMCYAVTAVHVAISKTFGFAPDSLAFLRAVLCLLAGLVPFAVIDYAIAQWRRRAPRPSHSPQ
jgi:hypothetical protein